MQRPPLLNFLQFGQADRGAVPKAVSAEQLTTIAEFLNLVHLPKEPEAKAPAGSGLNFGNPKKWFVDSFRGGLMIIAPFMDSAEFRQALRFESSNCAGGVKKSNLFGSASPEATEVGFLEEGFLKRFRENLKMEYNNFTQTYYLLNNDFLKELFKIADLNLEIIKEKIKFREVEPAVQQEFTNLLFGESRPGVHAIASIMTEYAGGVGNKQKP